MNLPTSVVVVLVALILCGCSQAIRWKFVNAGNVPVSIRVDQQLEAVGPRAESSPFAIVKRAQVIEIVERNCKYRFRIPLGEIAASDAFDKARKGNLGKVIATLELSGSKELVATLIDNPSADVGLGFPLKSTAGCESVESK